MITRFLLAFGVCGGLLGSLSIPSVAAERPNVVVFLIDDMGLMDTSVPFLTDDQGRPERHPLNDFYRTPNMERLAHQGIRFSNFYAMSVCSPTRVSIMTGQTSARHRTTNWIRPDANNSGEFGPPDWQWQGVTPEHVMLPQLLQQAGYRTIHCGKGHFGPRGSYGENPENFGFAVNIGGDSAGQPGSYYGTENFGGKTNRGKGKGAAARRAVPGLDEYHGQEIYLTEALSREVNEAIADAVHDRQPFFAYIPHYAVHAPFQPDPRFVGHYADRDRNVAAFASMIEGIDKSLGDVLDHLRQLGVAENTLVFFLGDNGTDAPLGPLHDVACAAPLRGKKGTHYEGGMRVPFIAAWAQPNPAHPQQQQTPIAAGQIIQQVGIVYDLFPTILALAGVQNPYAQRPAEMDGQDLRPWLAGEPANPQDREFLMHFPHEHRSSYFTVYRRGPWKLVMHHRPSPNDSWEPYELFDLAQDRAEARNLAQAEPQRLKEMKNAMLQALQQTNAQMPR